MNATIVEGPFCRIVWNEINLNSSNQIKEYLLQHGWQPDEWNYKKEGKREVYDDNGEKIKTSPKLTESSFHTVKGDIPQLIARRNILIHRKRMLKNTTNQGEEKGFLNIIRSDGRIGAGGVPQGTNTGRARHRGVVNIPGAGAVYGSEIRELFIVPDDKDFFGIDAQALEGRCLAHYLLNYPEGDMLADIILNKDIHEENAKLWGCSRKEAKSPFYALLFGAQPQKLAQTMQVSLSIATRYYNNFWSHYNSLSLFRDDLVRSWKSRGGRNGGFLRGLDGRKLWARSEHSLVNLMVQSTGSILVKLALIWINKRINQHKINAHQIIWMHDEGDFEVAKEDTTRLKEIAEQSFLDAGKFFGFKVPLIGTSLSGRNWRECH